MTRLFKGLFFLPDAMPLFFRVSADSAARCDDPMDGFGPRVLSNGCPPNRADDSDSRLAANHTTEDIAGLGPDCDAAERPEYAYRPGTAVAAVRQRREGAAGAGV